MERDWMGFVKKHWTGLLAGVVVVATVATVLSSGPSQPPEPAATLAAGATQARTPPSLTFAPVEAPPGAPVLLSGVPQLAGPLEVRIGDRAVPAQRLADGRIQAHVPVTLGEDGWPLVPQGRLAIEVRIGGQSFASGAEGLRVLALERAPGTTAAMVRDLQDIAAGYALMFETLPALDDDDRAHRGAVVAVLDGLLGTGDRSLSALLAGESAWLDGGKPDLELTDALLASSGIAGHYRAQASAFQGSRPGGSALPVSMSLPFPGAGPRCRSGGKAFDLACQMQVQATITQLSQNYIKPTADAYANLIGLALGALDLDPAMSDKKGGIPRVLAVHQITSALLSVVSFTMDKIAPSLLPSVLDRFELEVDEPVIRSGEMTRSRLIVEARNQPQTITTNDLIDLVKSIIGVPGLSKPFEEAVGKVGLFVIDLYLAAVRNAGAAPPPAPNPDVFTMPLRTWGPIEVDSPDLVRLMSLDQAVLEPRESEMEWFGASSGAATVRMMPRVGERAKVLQDNTLCLQCVWSGGAFGEEMAESSQRVAVDLKLEATPPHGRPPHRVKLEWSALPATDVRARVPCTIDFGDGSEPERITDCIRTRSVRHTYEHTSRLEPSGAFEAAIRLDHNRAEGRAEVFTEWSFHGTPAQGKAPQEVGFSWEIPWPSDRTAPACEFDPGDGSERERFDDCLATVRTTHTYDRRGSFVPSLTLMHEGRKDTKTTPVSMSDDVACEDLLKYRAWAGAVSYRKRRMVRHPASGQLVMYRMQVDADSQLPERTRLSHGGEEYLVQYYAPLTGGGGQLYYRSGSETFMGKGFEPQTPDMTERGSSLSLTLNARTCTYEFYFQGEIPGTAVSQGQQRSSSMLVNSVFGSGAVLSSGGISGSAAVPVLSRNEIEDNSTGPKPLWMSELDAVSNAMRGQGLGDEFVDWHFWPVE